MEDDLHLPLFVRPDVRAANPRFDELLRRLSTQVLTPTGERKTMSETYQKAHEAMQAQRERHLRFGTLYTETKDIINAHRCQTDAIKDAALPGVNAKVYDSMHHVLLAADVSLSLELKTDNKEVSTTSSPSNNTTTTQSKPTLYGLQKQDIELAIASKAPSKFATERQTLYQYILAELDERLRTRVQDITEFNDPLETQKQIKSKKAPQIAEIVAKKKEQLRTEKKQLDADDITTAISFAEYYQVLDRTFWVVAEILKDYKFSLQFKDDQLRSKWLQANCQHLIARLKLLQSQVMRDTYTPSKVEALAKVRQHLESAIEETMAQHEEAVEQVQRYERAGTGFDGLVREYASLLEELAQKKWTIERIKV